MKRRIVIEIEDGQSTIVEDTGATLPDGTQVRVEEHFVFYQSGAVDRKPLDLTERDDDGEHVHFSLKVFHGTTTTFVNNLDVLSGHLRVFSEPWKNAGPLTWHKGGATWKVDGRRGSVPGIIEVEVMTAKFADWPVHQSLRLVDKDGKDVEVAWLEGDTTKYSDDIKLRINDKVHGEVIVTGWQQISMYLNLTYPVQSPTGDRSNWGLTQMRGREGFVWNATTLGKHLMPIPVVECEVLEPATKKPKPKPEMIEQKLRVVDRKGSPIIWDARKRLPIVELDSGDTLHGWYDFVHWAMRKHPPADYTQTSQHWKWGSPADLVRMRSAGLKPVELTYIANNVFWSIEEWEASRAT